MRRILIIAGLLAGLAGMALATACSGDSDEDGGATPDATRALQTATADSATVAAARTVHPALTVLPDGTVVTGSGTPIPAALATEIAGEAASPSVTAPDPNATPTPPLCVANPDVPNCQTPPPQPTPVNSDAQGLAFASDPVTATTGQTFTVGLVVATAPEAYQGYEWNLVITGPVEYVEEAPSEPAGLDVCAAVTEVQPNEFYGGCIAVSGTTTYTGPVGTITLRCTGSGSATLHLRTAGEEGNIGFQTGLLGPGGAAITGSAGPDVPVSCQ